MAKRTSRPRRAGPTADSIRKDLAKGQLAPVYLLHGQDEVEKESVLKAILDAAVAPPSRSFNLDVFHGDDADISEVINRASAFPMMAERRAIVIKSVDRFPDSESRELLPLIQKSMDTTVLVLTAEKPDGRKKLYQEIRKAGMVVDFKIPYDREVPAWIQRRAADLGKSVEPEAVHLLHVAVGTNPADLLNELEKLVIHAGDRDTITRDDVAWVVSASRENTVFELNDAIGERRTADALRILEHLIGQGESAPGLVAMMSRHINLLRKTRWMQQARASRSEIATQLKVPPFFIQAYLDQSRRYDDAALWNAYDAILDADDRLKSRSRSPMLVLTRAIVKICRKPSPVPASDG